MSSNQSVELRRLRADDPPQCWLPPRVNGENGRPRRVGIELELAGLEPAQLTTAITSLFGGKAGEISPFQWQVDETRLGKFGVELDWQDLKNLGEKHLGGTSTDDQSVTATLVKLLSMAVEQLIPWEIVAPPVTIEQLPELCQLVSALRHSGAQGTRASPQYAFGLHLNPELPDLQADTITAYLKAFLCLYDWIDREERTDLLRKATYYINHFDQDYIRQVIQPDYWPPLNRLIGDYLVANPTRNRSLDLLPLFAHIDAARVKRAVDDPRVKGRPTFHYRLPNCDIDNPNWNLNLSWGCWLEVEKLAGERERIDQFCREYLPAMDRLAHRFDSQWAQRTEQLLADSQ